MKHLKRIMLLAPLGMLLSATSFAAIISYDAILTGPGESPPNASPGTGFASFTLDTTTQMLAINVSFSGLTTGTTASHIHCCTPAPFTGTAGVATTTPTFTGFPLGVTSGLYNTVLDLTQSSSYNPAFITANGTLANAEAVLIAGLANGTSYLNIHTSQFGGGEIRGFIVAAPEPGTLLLAGAAVIGLMLKRRAVRS